MKITAKKDLHNFLFKMKIKFWLIRNLKYLESKDAKMSHRQLWKAILKWTYNDRTCEEKTSITIIESKRKNNKWYAWKTK